MPSAGALTVMAARSASSLLSFSSAWARWTFSFSNSRRCLLSARGRLILVRFQSISARSAASLIFSSNAGQGELQRLVVGGLGPFEDELRPLHGVAGPLQDDLLGLLGQVVGLVHLLELPQFLLLVLDHVLGHLEHERRSIFSARGFSTSRYCFQSSSGDPVGSLVGLDVQRGRLLQGLQLLLGLL